MSGRSKSGTPGTPDTPGSAITVAKGDVIWVPYRRNPLWPALVQNVYPKKVTYLFFPLPEGTLKRTSFSCPKKSIYALTCDDYLPADANLDLLSAYALAVQYLTRHGWIKGSNVPRRPFTQDLIVMDSLTLETCLAMARRQVNTPSTSKSLDNPAISDSESETKENGVAKKRKRSPAPKPVEESVKKNSVPPKKTSPPSVDDETKKDIEQSKLDAKLIPLTELRTVIEERTDIILKDLWNSHHVRSYAPPPRAKININLEVAGLLSDDEADHLFDRIMNFVTVREQECRMLPAVHLVSDVLFPEVVLRCLQVARGITRDEARDMILNTSGNDVDKSSQCGFEELVRVACEERARGSQS